MLETAIISARAKLFGESIGRPSGRYVIVGELGRGGMGTVYRAYDPKLHREVALKVLRVGKTDHADGKARLVREARAMAQLSHPNVVAVHDVELGDDQVVIAMELVEGDTLSEWLLEDRPWRQIVGVFCRAGDGLAAAHHAGIVHRDFKSSNVLLSAEGAVKVTDLGLAKSIGEAETKRDDAEPDNWSEGVTQTGTVVGTQAFMAPEQHKAADVDARADQYAFCVALWRALVGKLPFQSVAEKETGAPAWPAGGEAPRRIGEVLRRGLAVRAADRWPSMEALLVALRRDASARVRRWALVGGAALVLVSAVVFGSVGRDAPCTGAREAIEPVWREDRARRIKTALLATDVAYAADTWSRISAQLDAYATTWAQQHREACEATTIRGEQSAAVLDLRMACLARAKGDLSAAVDLLENADASIAEHAIEVATGLPRLERCEDIEALQAVVPPPEDPQIAAAVAALHDRIAAARAKGRAGNYPGAREDAEEIRGLADDIDYPPIHAEAAYVLGQALFDIGDYTAAEPAYERAQGLALEHRMGSLGALASASRAYTLGALLDRPAEGRVLADVGLSLAQANDPDGEVEAVARRKLGLLLLAAGDYPAAETELKRSLELRRHLGGQHYLFADALVAYSNVLVKTGRLEEALASIEEATLLYEQLYGPDHPETATTRLDYGVALQAAGAFEEAEVHLRAAVASLPASVGSNHPSVIRARGTLAFTLLNLGRLDEAESEARAAVTASIAWSGEQSTHTAMARATLGSVLQRRGELEASEVQHRRALAAFESTLGASHPNTNVARANLANAVRKRGDNAAAEELYRTCLAGMMETLGPEHPKVAQLKVNLSASLRAQGKLDEAAAFAREALELFSVRFGADDRLAAVANLRLGQALAGAGSDDEAQAHLGRAHERLRAGGEKDRIYAAESAWELAQLLARNKGDRARARELAEYARGWLAQAEDEQLEDVERFLAELP